MMKGFKRGCAAGSRVQFFHQPVEHAARGYMRQPEAVGVFQHKAVARLG